MKAIAVIVLGLLMSGCGTQEKRVDCEWRLKPINPPVQEAPSVPSNPSTETGKGITP